MSFVATFRKQDALPFMPVFLQEFCTVNRTHYAVVSLIGAIPAAALCYFLLIAVTAAPLDNMTLNVKILTFFTMTLGVFVAVGLPFWILFLGPKAEKTDEVADKNSSSQNDTDDFSSSGSDEAEDILEPEEEEFADESESEMASAEDADIYEADE